MHVQGKALAVVSTIILLLSGFFLAQGISRQNAEIETIIAREEEEIDHTVRDIEKYAMEVYRVRIRQVVDNSGDLREAFARRNRELLYRLARPLYDDLREENRYFHAWDFNLPDGTVFLRVQDAEMHGDDLSATRKIIRHVHENRKPAAGYDVGKHGLIYWVVHPVFHGGEYVGAMEMGISATQIVETLKEQFRTEVATVVRAERWSKATLVERGFRHYGDSVLMIHEDSVYTKIHDRYIFPVDQDQRFELEGRTYILHCCSILQDYSGAAVGNILVLQDITAKVAEKRKFILLSLAVTGVLVSVSFGVLFFSFRSLIGKLESYAEDTEKAKAEIERSRDRLELRVKERTAELQDSHERLLLVLDGLEAVVYVADMATYEILFINKYARETFGEIVGRKCWQTIQSGQSRPCAFCTNVRLVGPDGHPAGVCSWEFWNASLGKWYYIQDRAIRWVDGRLVRLAIATDITERKASEERLKASLAEKEVLLKEIHHRVKNNMQIISSLLNLESAYAERQNADIFRDSQSRIKAMSLIHEKLYQSKDLSSIDLQDYLGDMVASLYSIYGVSRGKVTAAIDAGGVVLNLETSILCGLIVNELVTNSLRHAFPGKATGEVRISLAKNGSGVGGEDLYQLTVSDNGVGVAEGITLESVKSLGLQLVVMLAEHQLGGKVSLERAGGARFSVIFRELEYRKRT